MHFWLVEHHIKHWHFQCCYNQCAPTKGWFAKTKIVSVDKNQGTYIPQILFISILKPEPHFFQTTTESINMHYETCTKLAQELSNLWTTYSALLAEEHQILTEQHQTSIIHCHEDIEHTEIVQTSFNFFDVSISFYLFQKKGSNIGITYNRQSQHLFQLQPLSLLKLNLTWITICSFNAWMLKQK